MQITPLKIQGAALVEIERLEDERGYFARSFCRQEFKDAGLDFDVVQSNLSHNAAKGTLRGLHYQDAPKPDPKLVSCIRGAIFDVVVDLRKGSQTYCQWVGVQLTADNAKALFVPPGCAHGFITLCDDALVNYLMGEVYVAALARGVRWNDPAFAIDWPENPVVISERDAAYPDFQGA
ncbi:dTDP-4-dehydrorhamnose 3,5-epimerase [Magnetovibrio blakemorei]|uniref:dTDP-4-dehydrorhamnose 3,5-epimerase n=1 Tax=Magnetovibrio blakemorei TaxID=28181 RepID=A0A1E5Q7K5_9PROT|nr:dTDP-4-dehydrorhamnose 3,5-epimerase [Magnetovibrio blakemorei]OEJ66684.1 dTDP-4-dehydrorhamnose 3,5-epimerase [Magnetovibrio blakemorei]